MVKQFRFILNFVAMATKIKMIEKQKVSFNKSFIKSAFQKIFWNNCLFVTAGNVISWKKFSDTLFIVTKQ